MSAMRNNDLITKATLTVRKAGKAPLDQGPHGREQVERQGLAAKVSDGIVYGTRRIDYDWPENPLVSIVIQTRDREEYLRPLLESMHELTQYTNYELVIVDNETSEIQRVNFVRILISLPCRCDSRPP